MTVEVERARRGFWSNDSSLGQQIEFSPQKNNSASVLKMGENGHPEMWTVQLGLDGLESLDGEASLRANIKFGCGGVTQEIEADWLEGTVVSVVANTIEVQATWDDVATSETSSAYLRASVGLGGCNSRAQRTLIDPDTGTADIPVLSGGSANIRIPKFARRIRVYPSTIASSAALDAFFSEDLVVMTTGIGAGTPRRGILRGAELSRGLAVPVVADARFFQVENNTAEDLQINAVADLF